MIRVIFRFDREPLARLAHHRVLQDLGKDVQGFVARACTTRSYGPESDDVEWLPQPHGVGSISRYPFLFEIELPYIRTNVPPADKLRDEAAALKQKLAERLEKLSCTIDRSLPLLRLSIDGRHEYV